MKWIKNLESIAITKTSGKCPHCGSNNRYYYFVVNVVGVVYVEICCNDCKSEYHISRVLITEEYNLNKEIPKNIIYR